MSDFTGLYDIRDYRPSDKNLIMASFLRGLYYGFDEDQGSWFRQIDKDIFMSNYSKIAEVLLTRSKINIACLKEDSEVIIGYSLTSKDQKALHWVFVKSAWRDKGIGKSLVPTIPTEVTHLSALGKSLLPKINNPKFNPWAL